MSFPPDVPLVTLEFGPFLDVAGQPLSQVIRIDPPQPIIHVPTGATIFAGHALVAHHATVQLLPTDLEDASPMGYTLTVTVGTQKRHIHLPQAIPHVNYQKLVAEQTEDHGEVWYPAEWAIDQAARAEAAADAAEDSEQAAAGHATDAQSALDLTVTARDLTLDARDTAAGHATTATEQAGLATTARTGAEAALAATLAASTIVGVGRPDIPATLTPDVAALVAAATSSAEFKSIDGPQGAWKWRKQGATWTISDGDTGWRNLSWWGADGVVNGTALPRGAAPVEGAAGFVAVRRIGLDLLVAAQNITATGTDSSRFLLPFGFRPAWEQRIPVYTSTASGRVNLRSNRVEVVSADHWGWTARTLADNTWPTTLPGTAA